MLGKIFFQGLSQYIEIDMLLLQKASKILIGLQQIQFIKNNSNEEYTIELLFTEKQISLLEKNKKYNIQLFDDKEVEISLSNVVYCSMPFSLFDQNIIISSDDKRYYFKKVVEASELVTNNLISIEDLDNKIKKVSKQEEKYQLIFEKKIKTYFSDIVAVKKESESSQYINLNAVQNKLNLSSLDYEYSDNIRFFLIKEFASFEIQIPNEFIQRNPIQVYEKDFLLKNMNDLGNNKVSFVVAEKLNKFKYIAAKVGNISVPIELNPRENSLILNLDKICLGTEVNLISIRGYTNNNKCEIGYLVINKEEAIPPLYIDNDKKVTMINSTNTLNSYVQIESVDSDSMTETTIRNAIKKKNFFQIDYLKASNSKVEFVLNDKIIKNKNIETKVQLLIKISNNEEIYIIDGELNGANLSFNLNTFFIENNEIGKKKYTIYLRKYNNYEDIVGKLANSAHEFERKSKRYLSIMATPTSNHSTYEANFQFYFTNNNFLALKKDKQSNLIKNTYSLKARVFNFHMSRSKVKLSIEIISRSYNNVLIDGVFLVQRNKEHFIKKEYEIKNITEKKDRYIVDCLIDLNEYAIEPLYWDLYLSVKTDLTTERQFIQVNRTTGNVKYDIDNKVGKHLLTVDNNLVIYPYITLSGSLSFTCREKEYYETKANRVKENIAYYYANLFSWYYNKKNIWIGFEKLALSAHESGYYFFKYVYETEKHENFYYVIDKKSPEIKNLENMEDKVLYFMSFKYFVYLYSAQLLISSDTKRNVYNLKQKKSKMGRTLTDKKLVYLQHGVNGLKKVRDFYKDRKVFDLVIAPSEYEKNMILSYWGYSEKEVVTTGLARWDALIDKSKEIEYKQIFIMPTWRTWMDGMSKEEFMKSDYFLNYYHFLTSPELLNLLDTASVKISFFLHPKFKNYIELFKVDSENVKTFGFLETPLDEMIMKSSLMITDYSSVIWEMFYLKKPCVFYHFDSDKYLSLEGAYMDFDTDLFGDVAYDTDELIEIIKGYIKNDFDEKQEFGKLRENYFTYLDHGNRERIYEAIEEKTPMLLTKKKRKKIKISSLIPFKLRRRILMFLGRDL